MFNLIPGKKEKEEKERGKESRNQSQHSS